MSDSRIARRSFLAAAAAPAILHGRAAGDTLRLAFLGTGNRGSFLLEQALRLPGVQVTAVCDIVEERAARAAKAVANAGGSARPWTDLRKMLEGQKDFDAVVLATPDWTHKEFDIAILETGKHLYAEKPLALTAADCKAVVEAAKRAKGVFEVGFQLRHDPNRNAAERFIHGGGLGKVLMCHGTRHTTDLPRGIPWYFDRTKCGDIMVDQGIHILDLFTWAIGSHPVRAMGSGGTNLFVDVPPGRTVMDNYSLILEYPGGQRVNFSHHYFDPPGLSGVQERVFGSEGTIDLIAAVWRPRGRKGDPVKLDVPNANEDATYMSLAAFADNVRGHKEPLNNAASALVSTLVPLMGTKAIYDKRIVTWEEIANA